MSIWYLEQNLNLEPEDDPWTPWYDTVPDLTVRAPTEHDARVLATECAGDEVRDTPNAWMDSKYSTCTLIDPNGEAATLSINRLST